MYKLKYLTVITIYLFLGASEELRFKGKKQTSNRKIRDQGNVRSPDVSLLISMTMGVG